MKVGHRAENQEKRAVERESADPHGEGKGAPDNEIPADGRSRHADAEEFGEQGKAPPEGAVTAESSEAEGVAFRHFHQPGGELRGAAEGKGHGDHERDGCGGT